MHWKMLKHDPHCNIYFVCINKLLFVCLWKIILQDSKRELQGSINKLASKKYDVTQLNYFINAFVILWAISLD